MSNDNETIHEPDERLIYDFFLAAERQGPGSPEATLRALSFVNGLGERPFVADIGCGTGGQTMVLARHVPGSVTGIDLVPEFIDRFNRNARELGLQDRVKGVVGSMDNLPFEPESLDLIWSEGAVYNIGFERGITEWRKFLKPGGYIAVSECVWLTESRPAEIHDYWMSGYPEIDSVARKTEQMRKAGYGDVSTFILPEECWTEHYYTPLSKLQRSFLDRHKGDRGAENLVESLRQEEDMYRKYKEFYGYAFFVARRAD